MNRRGFIGSILTATTALALDPERLLWVPGKKTIFIPPAPVIVDFIQLKYQSVNILLDCYAPLITELVERKYKEQEERMRELLSAPMLYHELRRNRPMLTNIEAPQ